MSAPPPSIRSIFDQALDLPSDSERQAYIKSACSGAPESRHQLEALLRAHSQAASFLESPPAGMTASGAGEPLPPISEGPGTKIGPYKLLQQIGEGGFGVVYMAEQLQPVRRKVALKIIKPGMDTKEVIARFESERQALALMDHPNIAKVLDAGATESGRPYFVMELVKGIPITQFCDDNHLPPQVRLELFVQVCNALQHAHQKGIIHRDLKPSNVMVTMRDGCPVPKVIDFGVAKATSQTLTERTLFTAYGQMIGTPAYMSPEQAEMSCLDIDTRSDIYSLGVLLYELLTGSTPFEAKRLREAGFSEMQRIIREEEPDSVSTRIAKARSRHTPCAVTADGTRSVPTTYTRAPRFAELDWIVMKSLDKDREQRYESAISLARDIRRYLSDEPVHACPPTALYRFRKYAKKHRASLLTISVIVATLIVAAAVSTWQAIEANQARQLADERLVLANDRLTSERKARQDAQSERNRAEANFEKALDAVDRMLTRVGDQSVNDIPRMAHVQKKLLQEAVEYYEGFLAERPSDPKIRLQAAKLYSRIAEVYTVHEEYSDRDKAREAAYQLLQALHRERADDPEVQVQLGRTLVWRAVADDTAKEHNTRKAIQILTPLINHPLETVASAAQPNACWAYLLLGDALLAQARYGEAENAFHATITLNSNFEDPSYEAFGYRGLARVFEKTVGADQATDAYHQAVLLRRKALEKRPDWGTRLWLAQDCLYLGEILNRASRWDDAIPHLRQAVETSAGVAFDFPMRPRGRELHFASSKALGDSLKPLGRLDEAEVAYRAALAAVSDDPSDSLLTKAIHLCRAVTAEFPDNADYQDRLAALLKLQAQHVAQTEESKSEKQPTTKSEP